MKILDRYILKSFVSTFATVFVILFFIFILQTVWLFIAELAGKGLDFFLIVKFLLFAMPRIIPLVLPLSVLLASIMTFGSFAENYEFAAMKSSGISLQRAMKSLIFFICALAVCSFFFANSVIPYAEYKFINFRNDIGKTKPALAIAEGQFSDIGSYNIKVEKKSGENGNFLTGVTIHKKSGIANNTTTVIRSKTGELVSKEKSNILQLILKDGYYYEDLEPKKADERRRLPFAKSSFKRYVINMDLSQLNKATDDSGEKTTSTNNMLNVSELNYTLDSLHNTFKKDILSFADNAYQRTGIVSLSNFRPQPALQNQVKLPGRVPPKTNPAVKRRIEQRMASQQEDPIVKSKTKPIPVTPGVNVPLPKDLLSAFDETQKRNILRIASGNAESIVFSIDGTELEMKEKIKNINNHELALFDKFVIAYACLLMFFIGAPLGAIIRKGGIGLPIVFAVLIFITFHFINTFGKKISQSDGLPPALGAWMSSIVLTPFAIMLTYRATRDMSMTINFDWIVDPFRKWFPKKPKTT